MPFSFGRMGLSGFLLFSIAFTGCDSDSRPPPPQPKQKATATAPVPRKNTCESMCRRATKCVLDNLPNRPSGDMADRIIDEGTANCVSGCSGKLVQSDIDCWSTVPCDRIESEQRLDAGGCPPPSRGAAP